jgi:hypothetical protein
MEERKGEEHRGEQFATEVREGHRGDEKGNRDREE